MNTQTPQWLTENDVSRITARAKQTLRNDRTKCKGIPYCKVGRSVRYKLEDVVDYMESRRVVPENRP